MLKHVHLIDDYKTRIFAFIRAGCSFFHGIDAAFLRGNITYMIINIKKMH